MTRDEPHANNDNLRLGRKYPHFDKIREGDRCSTRNQITVGEPPQTLAVIANYTKQGHQNENIGSLDSLILETSAGPMDVFREIRLPEKTLIAVKTINPQWHADPKSLNGHTFVESGPISDLVDLYTFLHEIGHIKQYQEEEFELMMTRMVPAQAFGVIQYLSRQNVVLPEVLTNLREAIKPWKESGFTDNDAAKLYFNFLGATRMNYDPFFDAIHILIRICKEKDANARATDDLMDLEKKLDVELRGAVQKPTDEQIKIYNLTGTYLQGVTPRDLDTIALESYERFHKHTFTGSWQEVFDAFWSKVA